MLRVRHHLPQPLIILPSSGLTSSGWWIQAQTRPQRRFTACVLSSCVEWQTADLGYMEPKLLITYKLQIIPIANGELCLWLFGVSVVFILGSVWSFVHISKKWKRNKQKKKTAPLNACWLHGKARGLHHRKPWRVMSKRLVRTRSKLKKSLCCKILWSTGAYRKADLLLITHSQFFCVKRELCT